MSKSLSVRCTKITKEILYDLSNDTMMTHRIFTSELKLIEDWVKEWDTPYLEFLENTFIIEPDEVDKIIDNINDIFNKLCHYQD